MLVPLLALAACTQVPVTPVALAASAPKPPVSRVASAACAAAASTVGSGSAEASGHASPIDPAPFLGKVLKRAPWKTDEVAITMDDGTSHNTREVVRIFQEHGAKATFFYVGKRMGYPGLVREVYDAGFEIGNHTWDHEEIKGVGAKQVMSEADRCDEWLRSITGTGSVFVRPPAGHYDDTTLQALTERGYILTLWSLHGHDTGAGTRAETIARGVVGSARGGDIILLHETNDETVKALPAILEGLQRKGLKPVTLTELLTRP
jgi:peptidoglycan/xylan/chitin deacetylase (PgdA/CDA1 family)